MGSDNLTRQQIDEIENSVMKATNKCERIKMKYDRISSVLVNAKAGIEHLADKLVFFIVSELILSINLFLVARKTEY